MNLMPAFAPRGLRTRLLLWTVGLAGLILAAVVLFNYVSFRQHLESEARARATQLALRAAARIDAQFGELEGLVRGMGRMLEAEALELSHEQLRALQQAVLQDHPQVHGVGIALLPELAPPDWPDTAPYAFRARDGMAIKSMADRLGEDWFILPRHLERPVWSEPFHDPAGGIMVTYVVPIHVRKNGETLFAGVIGAAVAIGWLDGELSHLPVGPGGYATLISRNGTFISHPRHEWVLNETFFSVAEERADPEMRRIGQRLVSGEPGLMPWRDGSGEAQVWLAWKPLDTAEWTLVTVVSQGELEASILALSRSQAGLGAVGLALLVLVVAIIARSVTRPVQALSEAAATLASGKLDAPLPEVQGRDEVADLTRAFHRMRDDLRRHIADLAETTAARERMNGELRIAHDIQMGLVPKTFPPMPNRTDLDLFALMEPALEVGGDFYDFFPIDADRLVVAIGDVSGKGVPAALFMAVTRSFLRSAFRGETDPGRVLTRVNADLSENNESCMFVTLFCAVIHLSDGWVDYANAGHNPPALVDAEGRITWLGKPGGPVAGYMPGAAYASGRIRLESKAFLLLYTDGVTEAMDAGGNLYGSARLAGKLASFRDRDCRACLASLFEDIRLYAAGTRQSDDITLLMFKRIEPLQPAEGVTSGPTAHDASS